MAVNFSIMVLLFVWGILRTWCWEGDTICFPYQFKIGWSFNQSSTLECNCKNHLFGPPWRGDVTWDNNSDTTNGRGGWGCCDIEIALGGWVWSGVWGLSVVQFCVRRSSSFWLSRIYLFCFYSFFSIYLLLVHSSSSVLWSGLRNTSVLPISRIVWLPSANWPTDWLAEECRGLWGLVGLSLDSLCIWFNSGVAQ